MRNNKIPPVSVGFILLGWGLKTLSQAIIPEKEKPQPITEEDLGYAEEIKLEQKKIEK